MSQQHEIDIQAIVQQDDPDLLVQGARTLASRLKGREATKTQVRHLFSTLRQIEMSWPRRPQEQDEIQQRDDAYRELVLFGPRLAYQAQRHEGLTPLASTIQAGIAVVGKDRRRLQRLVQFFEATVAYYIAGPQGGGA